MMINGRLIAESMYQTLRRRTVKLRQKNVIPRMAVILIGNDPASESYVSQKKKWAEFIGAELSLYRFPKDVSREEVLKNINRLNADPSIYGIIIQRPLPERFNKEEIVQAVSGEKDIDGFRHDSPFGVPVALAVERILREIYSLHYTDGTDNFSSWLKEKNIAVIGKGETAGGPIIRHFRKLGTDPSVIDSKTEGKNELIKTADIVISAVGKYEIIRPEFLKKDAIAISVGLHKGKDDKLHGDYVSSNIKNTASYYTPVTGGIGPVNVAYLLTNLITAAEKKRSEG